MRATVRPSRLPFRSAIRCIILMEMEPTVAKNETRDAKKDVMSSIKMEESFLYLHLFFLQFLILCFYNHYAHHVQMYTSSTSHPVKLKHSECTQKANTLS